MIIPSARWINSELTLENALFCEVWHATPDGRLKLASFRRIDGPEWISSKPPLTPGVEGDPIRSAQGAPECGARAWNAEFKTRAERAFLVVELRFTDSSGAYRLHTFKLHPQVAGTVHQLTGPEVDTALQAIESAAATTLPPWLAGQICTNPLGHTYVTLPAIAHPLFGIAPRHVTVRDVQFVDQTDYHSNLVFEREYVMQPGECCLPLHSNLVCIEDNATRATGDEGFFWLLMAPLPRVRARWTPAFDFLFAHQSAGPLVATACPAGYSLARVAYCGGRAGATLALQELQRAFYPPAREHPARIIANAWGDHRGASHLSETFVIGEIAAAQALGAEVVQIDDGWQRGSTVNAPVAGNTGVWNGFWSTDPNFWAVNTTRFPRGLAPVAAAATAAGISLGIWFAPDSTNDLANWEKDAAQILKLWREHGVTFFKLDALKLYSRLAETRFHALCDRVLAESDHRIHFDFDATAENRPTYWGRAGGELFLENRFSEKGNYHPHQTLRALWMLAHHVRPRRIRLEFLNPARNDADYNGDPLRPSAYPPSYLFAITMPSAPLAWFECGKLPDSVMASWQPLIALWKKHREAFHGGTVFPVGQAPDGYSWTGFISHTPGRILYALIFRELTPETRATITLPPLLAFPQHTSCELLAGEGSVALEAQGERITVHIPEAQQFLFVRWS